MSSRFRLFLFLLCITSIQTVAQELTYPDTVKHGFIDRDNQTEFNAIKDKEIRQLLFDAEAVYFTNPDSTIKLANKIIESSSKIGLTDSEILGLNIAGEMYHYLGDYPQSLEKHFRALELSRQTKNKKREGLSLGFIGVTRLALKEPRTALSYFFQAKRLLDEIKPPLLSFPPFNLSNIGEAYLQLDMPDSAMAFIENALQVNEDKHQILTNLCFIRLARLQRLRGNLPESIRQLHEALRRTESINDRLNYSTARTDLAEIYHSLGQTDSSIYYSRQALTNATAISSPVGILNSAKLLATLFISKNSHDSAFYYQDIAFKAHDTLYGPERTRQLSLIVLQERERQQESLRQQEEYKTKTRQLILLISLLAFLIISVILYRRSRQKHRANEILKEKNIKIEESLAALKATQAQLIQSEKMASLGELTAGIAHEIQNPLNFVNNFSEVNKELIGDLKQEINRGNLEEVNAIAGDIENNEEKINYHGKRADAIVKGMLQHSRSSSGVREPTDINVLCDEYLRLSYHGLRAKDKSFNAKLETDFDSSLKKIDVVPQEIGRAILNLINNAFYAVAEKETRMSEGGKTDGSGFEPSVSIRTKKSNGKVLVSVKDNGNGIPASIKEKIFQPFFTTKPTGQGTGLGLSLTYDIVKAHGGELKVETKEGEFTEFHIELPCEIK